MLITPTTKSVTEYTITLSEADAALAMADPYGFGDRLAEQLRSAGVGVPNGNGKAHPKPQRESHISIGRGRKSAAKNPKVNRAKNAGAFECPQCQQKFLTQGFLNRHLRQKHGQVQTEPAASASGA